MKPFPKRLLSLFAGIAGCAVCATALTAVVEYKPWGVPDSRRADFDAKLAAIDRRDALRERYATEPRPIAVAPVVRHHVGLQDPATKSSHRFEIRNDGDETLELTVGSSLRCEMTLDQSQVAPGESANATVCWTTGSEPGDFEHSIALKTNDPLNEKIQFKIAGTIKAALLIPESTSFAAADPAQRTEGSFVIDSQIWKDFRIVNATSDLKLFDWYAEPMEPGDPELIDDQATCGWRVRIWTTAMEYGHYSGTVALSIETGDGDVIERSIDVKGRVRPPIIFHSPEIHMTDGLDLGTRFSGKEYQFHLLVRVRGELNRHIEVLDVQPPELKASLAAQSKEGNYRLTLTIPADCPMVVFNIPEQHGYVEVGDPNDRQFKNWFPIHGAVVPQQD